MNNPEKMDVKDLISKAAKINHNWKFKQPVENSICSVTERAAESQVSIITVRC
jgi:hypothetical protein